MPTVPNPFSIDFSKLDLSKLDLSKLDLSKLDLSKLDLSKLRDLQIAGVDAEKVTTLARDAAYVAVGLGVLTVQQLQVRRRELASRLEESPVARQLGVGKEQLEQLVTAVETRLTSIDERLDRIEAAVDAKIEALLADAEGRLPERAGALLAPLGQAHDLAKATRTATRKQVRGLLRSA